MNLNKVIIAGRLVRDPEGKVLPSGIAVTSFAVATGRKFKDRDGKMQEQTEFHSVVVFGKQADACAQFLKKGQIVAVAGRLQTRNWEKDGVKQYRTDINGYGLRSGFGSIYGHRQRVGLFRCSGDSDGFCKSYT